MRRKLALALLLAAGCSQKRTEVMIGVATDLAAPDQLDSVKMEIYRDNVLIFDIPPWDIPGRRGGEYVLPASFGVFSDDGSQPRIEVQVHGIKDNQNIINRRAIFSLIAEQTLFMRMALVLRCGGLDCPTGQTCIEGDCRPEEVDARRFPAYTPGLEQVVTCQGPDILRNTQTGDALMTMGSGACPPDQHCTESTCYENKLKVSPFCTPPGQVCTGVEQFEDCFLAMCNDAMIGCFGADWQNGHFQGVCADFGNCYLACNCDPTCIANCQTSFMADGSACKNCLNPGGVDMPCKQMCSFPSCLPVGAIVGMAATKRETVAADGSVSVVHEPVDLTMHVVEALVGSSTIPATSRTFDGYFEIDGVPNGATWTLHYDNTYLVTTKRDIDLCTYVTGRADVVAATISPTGENFSVTGLLPWQSSDYVEFFSANAGGVYADTRGMTPTIGATSAAFNIDWVNASPPNLVKSSEGDVINGVQMVTRTLGSVTYNSASAVGVGMIDMLDGQPATIGVTMTPVTQNLPLQTLWKRSVFSGLRTAMNPGLQNPNAGQPQSFSIEAQPNGLAHDQIGGLPCLMAVFPTAGTSDIDLTGVMFGNPFPASWGLFATVRETGMVQYLLPGTVQPANAFAAVAVDIDVPSLQGGMVVPMVGPVGAPKISGQDAFGNLTGVGVTPTISWTAPSIGSADRYEVTLVKLTANAMQTTQQPVARIITPDTQMVVPQGVLQAGVTYYARIKSVSEPGWEPTRPLVPTIPIGTAIVLSGMFTP